MILIRMFDSNDRICHDLLGMKIASFQWLCARLRTYGLVDSGSVKVEEQVAIFLNTVGHDHHNRTGGFTLFRSCQIVSYYFHRVLQFCLGLYRDVVNNATIHNSPYEKDNVKQWFQYFQDAVGAIDGIHIPAYVRVVEQGKYRNKKQMITQNVLVACTFDMKFTYVLAVCDNFMTQNRLTSTASFRVPRPTTPLEGNDTDFGRTQVDPNTRTRHVRWSDEMDGLLITSLVQQVLAGHRRIDNGFTSFQVSKAIECVLNGCGVVVSNKNVRSRLKTLKKDYIEVRQLLSMSGFELDLESGRIVADTVAWGELIKGKPDFGKWKIKLCPRYDDLKTIFGNDGATGDRAVSGFDQFSPINVTDESVNEVDMENEETNPSPVQARKRTAKEGTNKVTRQRVQPVDESTIALSRIADSFTKIANAMEIQAKLETLNHVNWQVIVEKLEAMNLDMPDMIQVIKAFRSDDGLAKVFMNLTSSKYMRALVFDKLGRDPPPLP